MTRRADQIRSEILSIALQRALTTGLEGLSIGPLASAVGMSKSGLFARFGSKEGLQIAVLEHASAQFVEQTVRPALAAPRGEPRVRALFLRWIDWVESGIGEGGCVFSSTAWEFDDRPGPVRDRLIQILGDWVSVLEKAAAKAIEAGDFRADLDPAAFAQHVHGLELAFHLHARLFGDVRARAHTLSAFELLLADARAKEIPCPSPPT